MYRHILSVVALIATLVPANNLFGQMAAPPRVGSQPSFGNAAVRPNAFEPNKPVAMTNKIVKPIPLTAETQRNALANIDQHLAGHIADLNEKLKTVLPDELDMLSKTAGWKPEDQQALVVALRAVDPTAVYEAWAKGNPLDTAGAEVAGRETDVKRLMARLEQDVEKNKAAIRQDVADLEAAVGKLAATPAAADLTEAVKTLMTYANARHLIDSATPQKGLVAKLPTGNVTMIFDPSLPRTTAVVLSDECMLIGNEGHGSLVISTGNAAEALGLPIVTATALAEAEGEEITDGVVIINPKRSRGTVNYNINGHHYISEPGFKQHLQAGPQWVIEYHRGGNFGSSRYTLTPGTYHFTPTDLGWQLYRQRFEIVLDNSQSNQEFNFIFRGEDLTVPAGSTQTLNSDYPIVARFDRGNGSQFVAKQVPITVGTVQIGVSASDNLWDLFPTNENRRETAKLKPFNAEGVRRR
jgi:hypothetical protein